MAERRRLSNSRKVPRIKTNAIGAPTRASEEKEKTLPVENQELSKLIEEEEEEPKVDGEDSVSDSVENEYTTDDSSITEENSKEEGGEVHKEDVVVRERRKSTRKTKPTGRFNMGREVGDRKNGGLSYEEVVVPTKDFIRQENLFITRPDLDRTTATASTDADFDPTNPVITDDVVHSSYEKDGDNLSISKDEEEEVIEEVEGEDYEAIFEDFYVEYGKKADPLKIDYDKVYSVTKTGDVTKSAHELRVFDWYMQSNKTIKIERWEEGSGSSSHVYDFIDQCMPGGMDNIEVYKKKGYTIGQIRIGILATLYTMSALAILFNKLIEEAHRDDIKKFLPFSHGLDDTGGGSSLFSKVLWYILLISITDLDFDKEQRFATGFLDIMTMFHKARNIWYHNKSYLITHAKSEDVQPGDETGFYSNLDWTPILYGDIVESLTVCVDKAHQSNAYITSHFIEAYIRNSKFTETLRSRSDLLSLGDGDSIYKGGIPFIECTERAALDKMNKEDIYIPVYFKYQSMEQSLDEKDVIFCNLVGWYCNCLDSKSILEEMFAFEAKRIIETDTTKPDSARTFDKISKFLHSTFYSMEWNCDYYFSLFQAQFLVPLTNWYQFIKSCYVE